MAANNTNGHKAHVGDAAEELLIESKKLAHEMYEDGLKKLGATQKDFEEFSDKLLDNVREHPLKAVLIAGGVGFVLSLLLKK